MPEKSKRLLYLDIAKGVAIIAVVLGHCFPQNLYADTNGIPNVIAKIIYDFCYSWHMPVLFFISGWLFYKTWILNDVAKLKEKVIRLIIPYLTFSVLYIPLRIFVSGMANSEYSGYWKIIFGISPNGGVWFLYVLFWFMVLSLYIIKNEKILLIVCIVGTATNIAVRMGVSVNYNVLKYTFLYYVFFGLGILSRCEFFNRVLCFYNKRNRFYFEICVFLFFLTIQVLFEFEGHNILCNLIGIDLVIQISKLISKNNKVDGLGYIGNHSMSIYLLHGPVLIVFRTLLIRFHTPALIASAIMFIGGLLISLLIDKYLLHINKYIELIFLGDNSKFKTN